MRYLLVFLFYAVGKMLDYGLPENHQERIPLFLSHSGFKTQLIQVFS